MALTVNGTSMTLPTLPTWGTDLSQVITSPTTPSTSYQDVNITSTSYGSQDSVTWTLPDASAGGDDTLYANFWFQITNTNSGSTTYVTPYVDGVAQSEITKTGSSPYSWSGRYYPFGSTNLNGTTSYWNGTSYTNTGSPYTGTGGDIKFQARSTNQYYYGYLWIVGWYFKKSMLVDIWDKTQLLQPHNSEITRKWKFYLSKISCCGFPNYNNVQVDGTNYNFLNTNSDPDAHYAKVGTIVSELTTNGSHTTAVLPCCGLTSNGATQLTLASSNRVVMEGVKFTVSVS